MTAIRDVINSCPRWSFSGSPCPDCESNGICDPATGKCICNDGWTGETCNNPKSKSSITKIVIIISVCIVLIFLSILAYKYYKKQ